MNRVTFDPEFSECGSSALVSLNVIKTNAPKQTVMPIISSLVTSSPIKKWLRIASQKGEVLEITDSNPTGIKMTAID